MKIKNSSFVASGEKLHFTANSISVPIFQGICEFWRTNDPGFVQSALTQVITTLSLPELNLALLDKEEFGNIPAETLNEMFSCLPFP